MHHPQRQGEGRLTGHAPDRSLAQRMDALDRANQVRTARAQLKRDLKAGRVCPVDLILEPPEYLETAKVIELLLAVPKWGRVKAHKAVNTVRISPSKTIGGLSPRQRTELAASIGRRPIRTTAIATIV